jgi:hypothetical protein
LFARSLEIPQLQQGFAEVRCAARSRAQGAAPRGTRSRLLPIGRDPKGLAEVVVDGGAVRIEADGLPVCRDRFLAPPGPVEDVGEVASGRGGCRAVSATVSW